MIEVRIHGRDGQGAVIASNTLAAAVFQRGCYVQSFSALGVGRRGAPVAALARIDGEPVRIRCQSCHPDHVMVIDRSVKDLVNVTAGLKEGNWSRGGWQGAPDCGIMLRSPRDHAGLDGSRSASGFMRVTHDESGD